MSHAVLVLAILLALACATAWGDPLMRSIRRGRRRRVKLHLDGGQPSVEGIQDGRVVDGHYVILDPRLHRSATAQPLELRNTLEVPATRVIFVERLAP